MSVPMFWLLQGRSDRGLRHVRRTVGLGNLAHGVLPGYFVADAGDSTFPTDATRETLLINFWYTRPKPPNTIVPDENILRRRGRIHPLSSLATARYTCVRIDVRPS